MEVNKSFGMIKLHDHGKSLINNIACSRTINGRGDDLTSSVAIVLSTIAAVSFD